MHVTRFLPRFVVAALVMSTASCSDSSGPTGGETKDPTDLNIVQLAASSPPLFNPVDSFYAKRGENREVRIYFADDRGEGRRGVPSIPGRCAVTSGATRRHPLPGGGLDSDSRRRGRSRAAPLRSPAKRPAILPGRAGETHDPL